MIDPSALSERIHLQRRNPVQVLDMANEDISPWIDVDALLWFGPR